MTTFSANEFIFDFARRLRQPKLFDRIFVRFLPDRQAISRQYWMRNGVWPNLDEPKGFAEKLCWLKLHDFTPMHTTCADKLRVRDHVAAVVGPEVLSRLLFTCERPEDLHPEDIPADRFIVKTNHDQGGVYKVKDKATADFDAIRRDIRYRQRRNLYYFARERQYRDIKRAILVEEWLSPGQELRDIKLNCFNGRVGLIQVNWGRDQAFQQAFFTPDWQELPCRRNRGATTEAGPPPPSLARMIEVAEALAKPFRFVRIDLYDVEGRVVFGEMTFHPTGGVALMEPPEYERLFGDMIDLDPAERW